MQEPVRPGCLRIAYLVYRGNPRCGGQGVYTRHLTRELSALGHRVTVFSGPPYPELEEGVELVKVPSLDLYREPDPFRVPKLARVHARRRRPRVRSHVHGRLPRAAHLQPAGAAPAGRRGWDEFDLVHDNQSLGSGIARHDERRLARARDDPPSHHRRPRARARPRRQAGAGASRSGAGTASSACRRVSRAGSPGS